MAIVRTVMMRLDSEVEAGFGDSIGVAHGTGPDNMEESI